MQTPPLPPALVEPSSLSLSEARLTDDESHALRAHEATIAAGRETFLQVGSALLEIHDRRLYRESHQTFEHYVQDRWDFSRQHAYRLITAAGVAKNLSPTGDITELNERQTRALARLAAEDQPVVFELAKTTAPNGRIASSHLKNLVTVAQQVMETGAIGGESVAWDKASPEQKLAFLQDTVDAERQHQQRDQARRALTSSASENWYTPPAHMVPVREVLGGIDVDPASCALANETVQAAKYYDIDADGLAHDWPGRVFMNPPYCGKAGAFVAHLLDQYRRGITTSAIVLVSANSTDTRWFRPLFDFPICFAGRISFDSASGAGTSATFGSAFIYLGDDIDGFVRVFQRLGPVVVRIDAPNASETRQVDDRSTLQEEVSHGERDV